MVKKKYLVLSVTRNKFIGFRMLYFAERPAIDPKQEIQSMYWVYRLKI